MARKPSDWVKVSGWLFLLGIIIAIVEGIGAATGASYIPYAGTILVILGAIVGLLAAFGMGSITRDESDTFLLATIALIAAGASGASLGSIPTIGAYLEPIVSNIAALVAPAAVIVALEAIWTSGSIPLK